MDDELDMYRQQVSSYKDEITDLNGKMETIKKNRYGNVFAFVGADTGNLGLSAKKYLSHLANREAPGTTYSERILELMTQAQTIILSSTARACMASRVVMV